MKVVLLGAMLLPIVAHAQVDVAKSEEFAKKSGCTACHSVDKKIVGPAFREVATKYRSEKGAEVKLAAKVRQGGQGTWGPIPMPPNSQLKDEEIKSLVQWVLSTK